MSNELKLEELQAAGRLLLAAVGHRCSKAVAIPDLTGAYGSPEPLLSWTRLLNLAATPAVVRLTLQGQDNTVAASSLLRFIVIAGWQAEDDRDKVDLLVTWLAAKWHANPTSEEGQAAVFANLKSLFPDCPAALPPEASNAVSSLHGLEARALACSSLHELVVSGVSRRARALKQQLGQFFSHPLALTAAATWNLTFAAAMERLFVQGAVQLGQVDAGALLKGAQFFMATDTREGANLIYGLSGSPTAKPSAPASRVKQLDQQGGTPAVGKAEVNNIRDLQLTIHNYVMAGPADEHRHTVPLPECELTLSPAECEAFRASYFDEESFRGECARTFALLVSVYSRLSVVLASYKRKEHSSHLWHHDADCLSHLVPIADRTVDSIRTIMEIAEARGLSAKRAALQDSCDKLKASREEAAALLGKRSIPIVADAANLADAVRVTASTFDRLEVPAAIGTEEPSR